MGDKKRIEWTDATWNPVTGCTKVSQGCKHCYAERDWQRLQHLPRFKGRAFTDVVCHPERLDQPLRWRRPRRIFVNSMSDLFHDDVPDGFIDQVFAVMTLAPQHKFQVLTKRARRMREYMSDGGRAATVFDLARTSELGYWAGGDKLPPQSWPLPNIWLGVSVEDQATADERIPILLDTRAALRWISAEPLLGEIRLGSFLQRSPSAAFVAGKVTPEMPAWTRIGSTALDWVVCGGESGPKARPMHPDWARSLRDQCAAACVAFLHKQNGEFVSVSEVEGPGKFFVFPGGATVRRVGKRAAGSLLDGVQHDGYPA